MKPIPKEGPDSDGARSYDLAIAAQREVCIRKHDVKPRDGDPVEARWAREGIVPVHKLECAAVRDTATERVR